METTVRVREYPVTTICGSMRFYDEMLRVAATLTADGYIVLMPFVNAHLEMSNGEIKKMLDKMHKVKIDMSDSITVVGWRVHLGDSTKDEIEYAKATEKDIALWGG
jgi:hypothetical protein